MARKNIKKRRRAILRDFVVFVAVGIVMLGVGHWLEATPFGRQVRIGAYELMQGRLRSAAKPQTLQVVVVGIDGIAPVTLQDGFCGARLITPRDQILRLLQDIAGHSPAAIGVDIDFSPECGGFQSAGDPAFFGAVQKIADTNKVPIFLGVDRTRTEPRSAWLGAEAFAPLAAMIVVPYAEEGSVVRSMPLRLVAGSTGELHSLAAAMIGKPPPDTARWLRPLIERYHEVRQATADPHSRPRDLTLGEDFLVDFGAVPQLQELTIPASAVSSATDQRSRFVGRYVLLGDTNSTHGGDRFLLPGYERPVKGVYAHASTIYTLTQAPLLELTARGELLADISIALLSFCIVAGLRLYFAARVREEVAARRIEIALVLLVCIMLLIVGHFAVNTLRLVWIGYALVIIMQLLHLAVGRLLHRGHHTVAPGTPAWRRWLFEHPEKD